MTNTLEHKLEYFWSVYNHHLTQEGRDDLLEILKEVRATPTTPSSGISSKIIGYGHSPVGSDWKDTTNGEGWEKEFDKDFCVYIPYRDTELLCWKGVKEKEINLIPTARTVKMWIKETLTQAREEETKRIVEEIQNHKFQMDIKDYLPKVKAWKAGYDRPFDDGYEQARKDFIDTLTASLQK